MELVTLLKVLVGMVDASLNWCIVCGLPVLLTCYLVMALSHQVHYLTDSCTLANKKLLSIINNINAVITTKYTYNMSAATTTNDRNEFKCGQSYWEFSLSVLSLMEQKGT